MQRKIDQLENEMALLEKLVTRFPDEKREEILFDRWSLRDVLIHINAWNRQRTKEIEDLKAGREIERIDDYDRFNAEAIAQSNDIDTSKVVEDLPQINSRLIEAFRSIPGDLFDHKFWKGVNVTPSMWVGIDLDHTKGHNKEITQVMESGYKNLMSDSVSPKFQLAKFPSDDLENGYNELRHLLMLEDIFVNFEKITKLKPDAITYKIIHGDEADWNGIDQIIVNYKRGFWAYLSMIHELVHIVLRQRSWDQDPVLDRFFTENPEVNVPSRGVEVIR